eukprot:TRINITY_DN12501_c0_g1_i1.p2 TRINITY_DN12501_c0_g1~~TRINITY_DN12501_c0_g1_i1.p2  ORF type:complete len:127 (+),score=15.07 TRINITY_DN12501_c0_g1_i1:112-492(+)
MNSAARLALRRVRGHCCKLPACNTTTTSSRRSTSRLATTWACADAQLEALSEVKDAEVMDARGQQHLAIPLLQRAVNICETSMGKEALLTQAANRRLGLTLYRAGRLAEAEVSAVLVMSKLLHASE